MKLLSITWSLGLSLLIGMLGLQEAKADDIDIFVGNAGSSGIPNVIFVLDNTSNWTKASQKWPDQPTQGQAETDAISKLITTLYNNKVANSNSPSVNIGVAELMSPRPGASVGGGYLRFGARDVTVAANYNALKNIVGSGTAGVGGPSYSIYSNVNAPAEKINEAQRDADAAFYEVYKYFNNLDAFAGTAALNPFADYPGASGSQTGKGQGLDAGFALDETGRHYTGPTTPCSKNYVIFIANNANRSSPWPSSLQYESTSAGPALPAQTGLGSFNQMYTREWVRFLTQHNITTYILDAFNAQQNAQYSALLKAAAQQAGSSNYFQVTNEQAIIDALTHILVEIQSVNSAFAATSLPASATNRSVDQNEVFLGVFRPDASANPRWYGNLKRFQLILNNGSPDLGDVLGNPAINGQTGFLNDCTASFWSSDTSAYSPASGVTGAPFWSLVPETPPANSQCPPPPSALNPASTAGLAPPLGVTWSPYSDLPDGPFVEKGGAAEILRRGNIGNSSAATWQVNRTIKTLSGNSLADFSTSVPGVSLSGLGAGAATGVTLGQLVDFIKGWDSNDENGNTYTNPSSATTTETRSSIHADVIHSTPLPVTYNTSSNGVVIYYGSNDGLYHAVRADTGQEIWAFLAPEFFSRMYRQYADSPMVRYPNLASNIVPTPVPKDYGFDGSTGFYQSLDSTKMWIYPTMRRGGRMIYAFDVSPASGAAPTTPKFLWKAGCPDLGDDTGCTTNMSSIGQTWSTPQSATLKDGNTVLAPVILVGGGYDSTATSSGGLNYTSCEDPNTSSPSCSNRKGAVVYVIDAEKGPSQLLQTFTLPSTHGAAGSVAGDITLLDVNGDGYADYAYLADTNGFVYRIDFVDGPTTLSPLPRNLWKITQVAGVSNTSRFGRKFLFAPTLLLNQNKVYVGLGTGDREHPLISEYPYTTPVLNHFYMFIDDPSTTNFLNLDGSTMVNASGADCSTTPVLPTTSSTLSGWYMALNANGTGEQVVTPATIISGQVTWGTNRPLPPTTGACTNQLGEARGYLVDLLNGSGAIGVNGVCGGSPSTTYAGGGLPPPPRVGVVQVNDTNGNPTYVGVCLGCPSKSGGPSVTIQPVNPFISSEESRRRVYWYTPTDQ